MICAIRDYLVKINRGEDAVRSIESTILNTIDRRTGDKPRLTLNTDDREFFRSLTKRSVKFSDLHPTRDSHDLLLDAAKAAAKWVTHITAIADTNSVPDVLNRWLDYLEQDAQVVLLKASNGETGCEGMADMTKEPTQLDKFKEAARQLETDDDDERFRERLKQIVKQKLIPDPKEHE